MILKTMVSFLYLAMFKNTPKGNLLFAWVFILVLLYYILKSVLNQDLVLMGLEAMKWVKAFIGLLFSIGVLVIYLRKTHKDGR